MSQGPRFLKLMLPQLRLHLKVMAGILLLTS